MDLQNNANKQKDEVKNATLLERFMKTTVASNKEKINHYRTQIRLLEENTIPELEKKYRNLKCCYTELKEQLKEIKRNMDE